MKEGINEAAGKQTLPNVGGEMMAGSRNAGFGVDEAGQLARAGLQAFAEEQGIHG